jgi:hypothetical protein
MASSKKMPKVVLDHFKAKPVSKNTGKKGKLPPGLVKYLANKKKNKTGG